MKRTLWSKSFSEIYLSTRIQPPKRSNCLKVLITKAKLDNLRSTYIIMRPLRQREVQFGGTDIWECFENVSNVFSKWEAKLIREVKISQRKECLLYHKDYYKVYIIFRQKSVAPTRPAKSAVMEKYIYELFWEYLQYL